MKYLFFLQQVYRVPLNYDFKIYTYGPYSSEVMEDLDFAKCQNIISMEAVPFSGHIGYEICAADYAPGDFTEAYQNEIGEMLSLFGKKTAKELELLATIVYLYHNYKMNHWDCDRETIAKVVHEIKPHFNLETVQAEYDNLQQNDVLKKVG